MAISVRSTKAVTLSSVDRLPVVVVGSGLLLTAVIVNSVSRSLEPCGSSLPIVAVSGFSFSPDDKLTSQKKCHQIGGESFCDSTLVYRF